MAVTGMVALVSMILQAATGPAWWVARDVLNLDAVPNDFAAVNQGQLKWVASNACEELETQLPGGTGSNIWALISSFSNSNNFRPVNLGQLKYVAKPFYDRLIEAGYTTNYPWSGQPNDYALANIGQMKNVFSFDVSYDTDGDGIPDWWEVSQGLNPNNPDDGSATNTSSLAHGLSNLQVYWNPSVLVTDNYSSCSDGVADWWKVQTGYAANTPADTVGANGSTLVANYQAGANPNDSQSLPDSAMLDRFDYGQLDLVRALAGLPATQWTSSTNNAARIAQLRTSIEGVIPKCLAPGWNEYTNVVPYATLQSVLLAVGNTTGTWSDGPLTNQINELTDLVLWVLTSLPSEGTSNSGVPYYEYQDDPPAPFETWTVTNNYPTAWGSYSNWWINTYLLFQEKWNGACVIDTLLINSAPYHDLDRIEGYWGDIGLCWYPDAQNYFEAYAPGNAVYCSPFKIVHTLYVPQVWVDIVPVFNHASNGPFRFWINDDADSGDISSGNSDLPGQSSGSANYADNQVNGRSDLLDFFPVWFDLWYAFFYFPPSDGFQYKLRQDDAALKAVYTDLTKDHAGDYLTTDADTYGNLFNQYAHQAGVFEIPASGVGLSDEFLNKIMEDEDKGVLLMEATKPTTKPLVLEIWKDSQKVFEKWMPLNISSVTNMYRWVNLRGIKPGGMVPCPPQPANFPDAVSNGKQFVFVHGYSVTEQDAKAWNAEMFKRLYQSGSRAMFTAVAWRGDDSKIPSWLPLVGGATPNYYLNVTHAFKTAESLKKSVVLLPGDKYIAGHSLGNMVVSSAIVDHGMSVNAYFMLDAAVPMEAYDSTVWERNNMRHPNWQGYTNTLWASDWHQLFDTGDGRRGIAWRGRFGNIANAYNFYSSTEDVLENGNGQVVISSIWATQEMLKGRWLIALFFGPHSQGGWGFTLNTDYHNSPNDPPTESNIWLPEQANGISPEQLKTEPFFKDFRSTGLCGANGSALAQDWSVRAQTLAEAIPALSFASGRNELSAFTQSRNFNMHNMKNGWPQERLNDQEKEDHWLHSDIRYIAYPFTYKLFDKIVEKGALK